MKTQYKRDKTIYLRPNARRRPTNTAGMVLGHNHIQHNEHTPIGYNGFRAFFFYREDRPHFVECPCGWRPELGEHYAHKEHVEFYNTPEKRAKMFAEYAERNEKHWHHFANDTMTVVAPVNVPRPKRVPTKDSDEVFVEVMGPANKRTK
jgi:hypothetical protein